MSGNNLCKFVNSLKKNFILSIYFFYMTRMYVFCNTSYLNTLRNLFLLPLLCVFVVIVVVVVVVEVVVVVVVVMVHVCSVVAVVICVFVVVNASVCA